MRSSASNNIKAGSVLRDLIKRPHFFGVAAVEQLQGEATVFDGAVTITTVNADGKLQPVADPSGKSAALLVGAYVDSWTRHEGQ